MVEKRREGEKKKRREEERKIAKWYGTMTMSMDLWNFCREI